MILRQAKDLAAGNVVRLCSPTEDEDVGPEEFKIKSVIVAHRVRLVVYWHSEWECREYILFPDDMVELVL